MIDLLKTLDNKQISDNELAQVAGGIDYLDYPKGISFLLDFLRRTENPRSGRLP